MDTYLGGLVTLTKMPDAIFVPAMQKEKTAVTEANKTGVEIIAVCDTNANPAKADYVIPANDDAVKAIAMIVNLVGEAAKKGKATYTKNAGIAAEAAEKEKNAQRAEKRKEIPATIKGSAAEQAVAKEKEEEAKKKQANK